LEIILKDTQIKRGASKASIAFPEEANGTEEENLDETDLQVINVVRAQTG
jgi:hypothetical protein